jgi:hypothetical protein
MTAAVLPLPAQAYVYVIGAEDGPQKIGVAIDPQERCRMFQTANHVLLKISLSIPVSRNQARYVERYAHWLLEDKHVRGEWFDVSPDEARQVIETAAKAIREGKRVPSGNERKATPVSVRFDPHVKEAIERAAKADVRPVATWVEKLVIEAMKAKGLLKDDQ